MAKYTADIEIAVRGGQQIDGVIKSINRLNNSINVVNRNAKLLEGKNFNVASMENYARAVSKAERALRKAAEGTTQEASAVSALVTAINIENKARERRNFLIAQEVANRRKVIATANAGVGVQGPQAAPIRAGRGPASPIRGTVNMPGSPAALAAESVRTQRGGGGIRGRLTEALGGGIIGAGFPLLFGQSGGAAIGGAIGGVAGGLAGPGGSFAGSILGTVLGEVAAKGQAIKQLGEDLDFSAQQTKQLSNAFKVANTDVEKFTAVIQNIRGVGLEVEDQAKAIQLVTRLTELYGGSFEKTGNAITSTLEAGKVTQATLNQLTSQGINIQQALADKYNVSRDTLLNMAKDGDISVQTLIDTLVELGNTTTQAINKPVQATDVLNQRFEALTARVTASAGSINTALLPAYTTLIRLTAEALRVLDDYIAGLQALATSAAQYITPIVNKFIEVKDAIIGAQVQLPGFVSAIAAWAKEIVFALNPALRVLDFIRNKGAQQKASATATGLYGRYAAPESQVTPLSTFKAPGQMPSKGKTGAKGPKPPEDRTALLKEDLDAMKLMSVTQDGIRDALFEGNKELAIRLEYDQKVADINRDAAKALLNANYETEKAVIRAQEIVRIKDAELEREDKLRELARDKQEAIQKVMDSLDMEIIELQAKTDAEKLAVRFLQIENQLKEQGIVLSQTDAEAIRKKLTEIQKITKEQEKANKKLEMEKELFQGIANSVAGAFSGAIDAAIKGTENLGEALRGLATDLLATIGKMLIMYGIAQALGALGGGTGNPQGIFSFLARGFGYAAKDGAYWPGGFEAFANGGVVTRPTMGLVGEGGEPEYIIPASKMRTAMSRYAAGARGSAVIPAGGDNGELMGNGESATPGTIDVRYTVERINQVDYVTADQFQAGMRQAAAQGAAQGEQRTLRRLQNSVSTRKRLGV